jgi:hypothetical protein
MLRAVYDEVPFEELAEAMETLRMHAEGLKGPLTPGIDTTLF